MYLVCHVKAVESNLLPIWQKANHGSLLILDMETRKKHPGHMCRNERRLR